jgi:hypothetical protein
VGVSQVGGIFVHKQGSGRSDEKFTSLSDEAPLRGPLPPDQEARARQLAGAIAQASQDDLLQIARALVASDTASLFGATEFKVRDLALGVAAKAYQQHLAQKKMATRPPA